MADLPETQYLKLQLDRWIHSIDERFPRKTDEKLDLQVAAGKELLEAIRKFNEATGGGQISGFQREVR
jgi:hypothetical protein